MFLFEAERNAQSDIPSVPFEQHLSYIMLADKEMLLDLLMISGEIGIIGHSLLGCAVGIQYTRKYPEKVKFLILLNGCTLKLDSSIRNIFWNLLPQYTRMNFHEVAQHAADLLIEKTIGFIRVALSENLADPKKGSRTSSIPVQHPGDQSALDEIIRHELQDLLDQEIDPSGISCPTLIIGAELDNFAPIYMAKILKKKIPNADLHVVTMAGHFGTAQRASDYNLRIMEFLRKNKQLLSSKGEKK